MTLKNPAAMISFDPAVIDGMTLNAPEKLSVSGTSEIKTVNALVGDNNGSYTVRTLQGVNAELSFTISGVTPNTAAMLDIEEIHQRDDSLIAYYVYINGTQVYGRTYAPSSDGPNHCFFDIPADVVGGSGALSVRIVSKCENELRFRRVWAISDPDRWAQEQGIARKMDVVLMLNEVPGSLNYSYLKQLVDSYRCAGMYNIGLCWEINYLQWGKETTEQYLNNVLAASAQTGATLYLGINSWWSGTPSGMDGLGGSWMDVAYQQITYDKNNADGRGQWKLTTPNEWNNTPWLSMNDDHYNGVREQRISETVAFIQRRTAELALAGQEIPAVHLYTENEPYYWPINWTQYDFDAYPRGVGDFSSKVIADAAKDGVTLDPTDGLSEEEALWLYRNLNTYISGVGSAMASGLGYNYITVKDGVVTYPTEQTVSNSYTHTPTQAIYPNWKENRAAWENHVLNSIHFGGEWCVWQDQDSSRALDYLLSYGSFSNINAERAGFPGGYSSADFRVLSQCYAYGLEGVVIYNVLKDSDQNNVKNEATLGATLLAPRAFRQEAIYESDFSKKTHYGINNTLIAMNGFRWSEGLIPNKAEGGMLIYKIKDAAKYSDGLGVEFLSSLTAGGRVEILAGSKQDALKSAGIFDTANTVAAIDPSLYAGGQEVYIGVRIFDESNSTTELSRMNLHSVRITHSVVESGRTDGTQYTYDENRARCQIIAARADTEELLERFRQRCGGEPTTPLQKKLYETAFNLYAEGKYGEAYAAVSGGISQLLPSFFTVDGYGQLGEYPISLEVNGKSKITVCLKEVSDEGVRFTMSASSDAAVTVSYLKDIGKWALQQEENGDWVISAGTTEAKNGKVSFAVELREQSGKDYPDTFEARAISTSGCLLFQTQDVRVSGYAGTATLNFASDVKAYRGADGTAVEALQPCHTSNIAAGDHVLVKLNEYDQITEIYAWYGAITGKVIAVEEISLEKLTNAAFTVQAADGTTKRLEIGWETVLEFTGATGKQGKLAMVERLGLQVGQSVTVQYCPYTVNDRTRAILITN